MVSSGNEWQIMNRYNIVNDSSKLHNKDIVMSQYASEIKCIHDKAGSQPQSPGVY